MPRKVVHVINSLMPGGAEMLLANSLAPGGLAAAADNTLVYLQGESEFIRRRIDPAVPVVNLSYRGLPDLPFALERLRKLIRHIQPDIIHTHLNPAGWYTRLACPAGIPQVHTLHTTYSMDTETGRLKRWLEKKSYFSRRDCNLIFLSNYTRTDFMQAIPFRGKGFVLPNFVPDNFFAASARTFPSDARALRLVAVGRLSPVKNIDYLLDVFAELTGQPISLDIYGTGDGTGYQQQINERKLNITLKGPHPDIASVLPQYDAFILPSLFEGFPLSVFEAMAAGLPLLVSDIAPLHDVVKEHALYFPLDNAAAVAGLLQSILHQQQPVNAMAAAALHYANATVRRSSYTERLLQIYGEVLAGSQKH